MALIEEPDDAVLLADIPQPTQAVEINPSLAGPPVAPKQRIYFYSSAEWESFLREWATTLTPAYVQIKQLGGTGDRGIDIAGLTTDQGLESDWDCFQGKHYADPLVPSDVYPEILKVLRHVVAGRYVLPRSYRFLAPKGCGTALNLLLSAPSELKAGFLVQLEKPSFVAGLDQGVLAEIKLQANAIDFSIFRSEEIDDLLAAHSGTNFHIARFGTPLPPRTLPNDPPVSIADGESRYVAQLVDVYNEKFGTSELTPDTVMTVPRSAEHFKRQRVRFYKAEALRLYARDAVPDGTFERLQDDIHSGVIEVAEAQHPNGYDRLNGVLIAAGTIDLSGHPLISVSTMDDRKGVCHQLANGDRLTWVAEN